MDFLQIKERIASSLQLGESQFREFKSAWEGPPNEKKPRDIKAISKDIGEVLVAFANADGGVLLVGVEDDATITGVPHKAEAIERLLAAPVLNVHTDTPLMSPIGRKITLEDKEILYFSIEKSTLLVHQTSDGRCLQRKDLQNLPVTFDQIRFERQEQLSREYDRQFVDNAQVTDLDLDMVRQMANHIAKGMSIEKCLQFLGLAEYGMSVLQIRRAALLLFAKDVSRWHPRCEVRIIRVQGTELRTGRQYNAKPDETASGNIIVLLKSGWEKLRPHLVETKLAPDALFKERVMYPEDACREALVNAIAHRDYSIEGRGIEILIFDDRMEVQSPGSLLSTVKIDELKKLQGTHQSRNALIARTLREYGYMREMGEGMRRIFRLMQDADLVAPGLRSESGRFSIILSHKSVFSDADQRWLDGFRPLKLTREEMLTALLGKEGQLLSAQKIHDTLGLVDWDLFRIHVDQMKTKGLIYNAKGRATRAGIKNRDIPRYAIRSPEKCEEALAELYSAFGQIQTSQSIDKNTLVIIDRLLSEKNHLKNNLSRLEKLLRILGLIDEQRRATSMLQGIWAAQSIGSRTDRAETRLEPKDEAQEKEKNSGRTLDLGSGIPRKIHVSNYPYDTTEGDLRGILSKYGQIDSLQSFKGFCFVLFTEHASAVRAIAELNGSMYAGREIRIAWARRQDNA